MEESWSIPEPDPHRPTAWAQYEPLGHGALELLHLAGAGDGAAASAVARKRERRRMRRADCMGMGGEARMPSLGNRRLFQESVDRALTCRRTDRDGSAFLTLERAA